MPISDSATTVDVQAVLGLLAQYAECVDSRNAADWADLFDPENGTLALDNREVTGRSQLHAFAEHSPVGVHIQGVPDIAVAENGSLSCTSSWLFLNAGTGQVLGGSYADTLIRDGDRLRFAVRRVRGRANLSTIS